MYPERRPEYFKGLGGLIYMAGTPNILCTICARGGSKGVKNKNIRDLLGKPLIAYTIKQALKWGRAKRIIVSTDSKKIKDVAQRYGASVPFMRPDKLATDSVAKLLSIRHALIEGERAYKEKYDIIVDLDASAPVRKVSDIEGAYQLFKKRSPKSVFSVTSSRRNPYFNMVEVNNSGYAALVKDKSKEATRRQDAPKVYDMNASIYVYARDYLLGKATISPISDESLVWVMDELSAFDIDCETDFQFIRFLVLKGLVRL